MFMLKDKDGEYKLCKTFGLEKSSKFENISVNC